MQLATCSSWALKAQERTRLRNARLAQRCIGWVVSADALLGTTPLSHKLVSSVSSFQPSELFLSSPSSNIVLTSTSPPLLSSSLAAPCLDRLAVAADACIKSFRYANAATSQEHIEPSTNTFLGSVSQAAQQKFEAGELGGAAAVGSSTSLPRVCTSMLHCSRTDAVPRIQVDRAGVVAVVCGAHSIPLKNCAIAMPAAECHGYYDLAFERILVQRPDVLDFYLDIGCRYDARFRQLLEELISEGRITPSSRQARMLVPWMHAFDHNLECQLAYSGLYAVGAGRRIGETTEQLWSETKPGSKPLRYASLTNWHDQTNAMFQLLTDLKQLAFPQLLRSKLTNLEAKQSVFAACPVCSTPCELRLVAQPLLNVANSVQ